MRKMFSEDQIKGQALEAINVEYNDDGVLEHNDPELFNEDVEFEGNIIDKNGNKLGNKIVLNFAHPVSISSHCLQFNDNNFLDGTYTIECDDNGSNMNFSGVIVVRGDTMRGWCTNYDTLYGEVVKCWLFYSENKINIQFQPLEDSQPISLDGELTDYTVYLVKIA